MYRETTGALQEGASLTANQALMAYKTASQADRFERLPINLSSDEIRAMVRDLLG